MLKLYGKQVDGNNKKYRIWNETVKYWAGHNYNNF